MAKIAAELKEALAKRLVNGSPGQLESRRLAGGADGWTVDDVVCTSGPRDRSFEEQHDCFRVVIVAAGTFQYRVHRARELMTPGSLLLGNANACFECGHEHGEGDRCISFGYTPEYFARLAADAGGGQPRFASLRVPAVRELVPLVSQACAGLVHGDPHAVGTWWEELSVKVAARAIQLGSRSTRLPATPLNAEARVTRAARMIEEDPGAALTLRDLAREVGLSPYHFLRTFERVTGVTPHRYVVHVRLREAAMRLSTEPERILDIAFDSGFGDVSNFNRAFRNEFGVSPRAYRDRVAAAAPVPHPPDRLPAEKA